MSGKGKKDKGPTAMGPGSTIAGLNDVLKKLIKIHLAKQGPRVTLNFASVGFKLLPLEIFKNEEIMTLTTEFLAQFNRLKKLPSEVEVLKNLSRLDFRSNRLTSIPATLFNCLFLEYVSTFFKNTYKVGLYSFVFIYFLFFTVN